MGTPGGAASWCVSGALRALPLDCLALTELFFFHLRDLVTGLSLRDFYSVF